MAGDFLLLKKYLILHKISYLYIQLAYTKNTRGGPGEKIITDDYASFIGSSYSVRQWRNIRTC